MWYFGPLYKAWKSMSNGICQQEEKTERTMILGLPGPDFKHKARKSAGL